MLECCIIGTFSTGSINTYTCELLTVGLGVFVREIIWREYKLQSIPKVRIKWIRYPLLRSQNCCKIVERSYDRSKKDHESWNTDCVPYENSEQFNGPKHNEIEGFQRDWLWTKNNGSCGIRLCKRRKKQPKLSSKW